jgi:hypothetical protein
VFFDKIPKSIVTFPTPSKGLKNPFQKEAMKWKFKRKQKEERVHFFPDLKIMEFLTLRAPEVIRKWLRHGVK